MGDFSLRWILEAAAAGEVFAAGHAEAGNDIPIVLSTSAAARVECGYRLTGRKQFGSNGPAWRWLSAHAIDADGPGGPQIVHAFIERDSPGVTVVESWGTLGMRPTQSHDTILDGVFVPIEHADRSQHLDPQTTIASHGAILSWPAPSRAARSRIMKIRCRVRPNVVVPESAVARSRRLER